MLTTDLTVAAVVHRDGKYLLVEEYAMGTAVISQPGGHLESGESPEDAVIREVLEETGCNVSVSELIGVYLWIHPQTRHQFLRIVFVAEYADCDETRPLDDSIIQRWWMTRAEVEERRQQLRTPAVLRCIDDFEAGRRQSDTLLAGMLPLHQHVDAVIARADLV
jgi:ADP-ribose pyrophosphatase YjhB (NUDIX family)